MKDTFCTAPRLDLVEGKFTVVSNKRLEAVGCLYFKSD